MKKFLNKKLNIITLVLLVVAFAVIACFGIGSASAPSTYYQTGEFQTETGYSSVCYQIDYSIEGETHKNTLDSVWLNIGSIDYVTEDTEFTFKALLARNTSGTFKQIKTYNFTNSKDAPVSGKWVCVADKDAIDSYSSYEYFALCLPIAYNVKLNELAFVGSHDGEFCLLPVTAVGAGVKSSLTSSLEKSGEFDMKDTAKEEAKNLIDEPDSFDLTKISGTDYLSDLRSDLSHVEIDMIESIRNLVDGRGYYVDGSVNPLGLYLLSIGTELFGYNAFGLRIMPLIFTLASIVMTFFLGKLCFGTSLAGLLASLIYAVGGYSLAFATAGTVDAIFVFLIICAFYAFTKFFKKGISNVTPERSYVNLLLGGLAFAMAVSVKTQALYFGVALVLIFVFGMLRQFGAYKKRAQALEGDAVSLKENKALYKKKFTFSLIMGIIGFAVLPFVMFGITFLAGYMAFSAFYADTNLLSYAFKHLVAGFTAVSDNAHGSTLGWVVNYGYQSFGTDKYIFGNMIITFVNLFAVLYGLCHIILLVIENRKKGLPAQIKYGVISTYIFFMLAFLCGWLFNFIGSGATGGYYASSVFASFISIWLFTTFDKENIKPLFIVKGYKITITRIITVVVVVGALVVFGLAVPGLLGIASEKSLFAWNVLSGLGL